MLVLLAERADTRNYTGERLPLSIPTLRHDRSHSVYISSV